MYKVIACVTIKAYELNERGECMPPAIADKGDKIVSFSVLSVEEVNNKVNEIYEKVLPCLS